MALREKVLLKKATKFELKESQNNKVNRERLSELGEILDDAYLICRPKPSDYHHRKELVRVFNDIAKELYGNCSDCPVVEEFGSFTMNLFSSGSDLDLSINFSNNAVEFPREKKIRTLRKFAKKFYALQSRGHVSGVNPIMSAKVPILKIVDSGTGIECDLSVENRDGILKSQIVHLISSIDERFQKLSFLMKAWAKAHDINSSKDRTLNSLSIILLVAFHLQTRDPPILPPFSAILKDGTDPATVAKSLKKFLKYGRSNTESMAELLFSLLIKLTSIEKLWPKGLCASVYQGSWISKTWDSKVGCISVEDFTDRSQNVARAVGKPQVEDIYKCIQLTIRRVSAFMDGQIQGPKLKEYLFGIVGNPHIPAEPVQALPIRQPTEGWGGTQQGKAKRSWGETLHVMPFDHSLTKRIRYTEGWGGTPIETRGGPATQAWRGTPTESWGGPATQGWGGNPTGGSGGPARESWGGDPIGSWGGTHEARSQEMRTMGEGWGGRHHQPPNGGTSQNHCFTTTAPCGNLGGYPILQPMLFPPHMLPDFNGSGSVKCAVRMRQY